MFITITKGFTLSLQQVMPDETAWLLACANLCRLGCLAVLFYVLNDFILRALGADYNKDNSEVKQLKAELVECYKQQELLSSLLIQVYETQQALNEQKPASYVDTNEIPFFQSYDIRDTRKQFYCPQSVWFLGFDGGLSEIPKDTPSSENCYFTDIGDSSVSEYPNSDSDGDFGDAYFETVVCL